MAHGLAEARETSSRVSGGVDRRRIGSGERTVRMSHGDGGGAR